MLIGPTEQQDDYYNQNNLSMCFFISEIFFTENNIFKLLYI